MSESEFLFWRRTTTCERPLRPPLLPAAAARMLQVWSNNRFRKFARAAIATAHRPIWAGARPPDRRPATVAPSRPMPRRRLSPRDESGSSFGSGRSHGSQKDLGTSAPRPPPRSTHPAITESSHNCWQSLKSELQCKLAGIDYRAERRSRHRRLLPLALVGAIFGPCRQDTT